jgi:hypothetical protein
MDFSLSVCGNLRSFPRSDIDRFSIFSTVYTVSLPSQSKRTISSHTSMRMTRVSWWTISASVRMRSIVSGDVMKNRCIVVVIARNDPFSVALRRMNCEGWKQSGTHSTICASSCTHRPVRAVHRGRSAPRDRGEIPTPVLRRRRILRYR